MKKPKQKVLIEVRGGMVVYVAATTKDVEVVVVDHDGDESSTLDTPVEKVYSQKGMEKYIEKILK